MASADSEYLTLHDVDFGRSSDQLVLDRFSMSVGSGEGTIVAGPARSGKTVLVNLIAGRLRPLSGRILIRNQPIAALTQRARARLLRSWGIVLEESTLLSDRSVTDNIRAAVELSTAHVRPRRDKIVALTRGFGLAGNLRLMPSMLSKREQKLLQFVMACARDPIFLIWDDPDSVLERQCLNAVIDVIRERQTTGTSVLITTSRPEWYSSLGWRVVALGRTEA